MKNNEKILKAISNSNLNQDWWKPETGDILFNTVKDLVSNNYSIEDAIDIVDSVICAIINEYGE